MIDSDPAEVWMLERLKTVLVQPEGLGVPKAAIASSDGTIGGSVFPKEALLGPFPSWAVACQEARRRAEALGYRVEYSDPSIPDESPEEDMADDDTC